MSENNAAKAAEQILIYLGYARAVSMEPGADTRRDRIQSIIESALLSKLRAPVADERAAQGYGSPADVAQRIEQYLYHDGRKNSATQLLYEAMKALRASPGNRNDE